MNMSLHEYQQQGAGFDIPDFWYLQICYKFLNESGTVFTDNIWCTTPDVEGH
jgi:hypothetical protein